jgi:hypothetical protein
MANGLEFWQIADCLRKNKIFVCVYYKQIPVSKGNCLTFDIASVYFGFVETESGLPQKALEILKERFPNEIFVLKIKKSRARESKGKLCAYIESDCLKSKIKVLKQYGML